MSATYDNWERLVAAVLKREQFRQLALAHSRESSLSSIQSDFSFDSPLYSYPDGSRLPSNWLNSSAHFNISIPFSSVKISADGLPPPRSEGEFVSSPYAKAFSFNELRKATRNFRPTYMLGEMKYPIYFKGWINEHTLTATMPGSGLPVAVKRVCYKELLPKVIYLGQLHHTNLVKFIGYCSEADYRLLVYEFMPRGNLDNRLLCKARPPLAWATRINVAIGAARGLCFLHEAVPQVIYRDFKTSHILLDEEYNAKLSGFALAIAGLKHGKTYVTAQVIVNQGYAAPEYLATGKLSAKCDVYSFGVILLELLSGLRAVYIKRDGSERNLVEWAKPYLGYKRKLFRIMDTKLEGQYTQKAAFSVASLSLQCLSNLPDHRPRMAEVLATLEKLQA